MFIFFGRLNGGRGPSLSCVNVVAKKPANSSVIYPWSRRILSFVLILVMEAFVSFFLLRWV